MASSMPDTGVAVMTIRYKIDHERGKFGTLDFLVAFKESEMNGDGGKTMRPQIMIRSNLQNAKKQTNFRVINKKTYDKVHDGGALIREYQYIREDVASST